MTLRKFYLVFTSIIAIFLFITGAFILNYINTGSESTTATLKQDGGLSSVIDQFKYSKKPFNVLLLGGDKVNKNADTMMLINVDPGKSTLHILSVPRDTKVKIEGKTRKINFAFPHGGQELATQTVEKLTGAKINYFVFVDTKAFRNIIDILGGVDIDIPADLKYNDPAQNLHINLKKGRQHLDGEMAEQFMRFRKANGRLTSEQRKEINQYYDGSDLKRIDAQQGFIVELIKQKANLIYLPKVNNVISTIYSNLETDITQNQIVNVIKGIGNFKMENIQMHFLPGEAMSSSPWHYICDKEKTAELINQFFLVDGTNAQTTSDLQDSNSDNDSSSSSKPSKSSTKTSTTKNNPSNDKSSIKGSSTPKP